MGTGAGWGVVVCATRRSGPRRSGAVSGGNGVGGIIDTSGDSFVWRVGRAEVTLADAGDGWTVSYTSVGRLLGPRQVLYQGRHRDATYAAWDVMARVVLASRDEDEGVRAGRSAVQWIKARPPLPRAVDTVVDAH